LFLFFVFIHVVGPGNLIIIIWYYTSALSTMASAGKKRSSFDILCGHITGSKEAFDNSDTEPQVAEPGKRTVAVHLKILITYDMY
jgi:hypothetical protein